MITTVAYEDIVVDSYVNNSHPVWPNQCQHTMQRLGPENIGAAGGVEGEEFAPLSDVTPSDRVKATPWSFRKETIVSPHWSFRHQILDISGSASNCGKGVTTEYHGDGRAMGTVTSAMLALHNWDRRDIDFVDSMSILKAQANLRRALANIPMMYAERQRSLKTIGDYSRAILNNVITMQRRDVKAWLRAIKRHRNRPDRLKKVASDMANRHLEFVFGVLPLIDDISGLCEFVGRKQQLSFRTGRGRHTKKIQSSTSGYTPSMLHNGWRKTRSATHRYSVRTGLRYDIDSSVLNDASLLGFNPIYAWYDMTPLSFVVGWFSNLNLWLQSLDATPGLTYRTGYSTKRNETTCSITYEARGRHSSSVNSQGSGASQGTRLFQNRVVHDQEPGLQSLYLVNNASFFAAAASVSLLVQRLVKTAQREISAKPFRYRGPAPRNLPPIRWKAQ